MHACVLRVHHSAELAIAVAAAQEQANELVSLQSSVRASLRRGAPTLKISGLANESYNVYLRQYDASPYTYLSAAASLLLLTLSFSPLSIY